MQDLLNEVKESVFSEYKRASDKYYPTFNSDHEAYSVIFEEYEEAMECAEIFVLFESEYWQDIRKNNSQSMCGIKKMMQEYAELAAAEWIQVAAMCYKSQRGIDE